MKRKAFPSRLPDAATFYATRRGQKTNALLAERLHGLLPPVAGRRVLGLGYARPFLQQWPGLGQAAWTATARLNVPMSALSAPEDPSAPPDCIVEPARLPFDDFSLDVVVLIHGLEFTAAPALLRAVWKCLADDGHLLIIVPNRTGLWAHDDSTPFGHGQPYSTGQLTRLIQRSLFRLEASRKGLAMPPFATRLGLRSGRLIDRAAGLAGRHFCGVHAVVARKDLYAGLPLQAEKAGAPLARTVMEAGMT